MIAQHLTPALATAFLLVSPLHAETVDFGTIPFDNLATRSVTVDGVTFKAPLTLYNSPLYFVGQKGAICSHDPIQFNCSNDMTITFNGAVRRLRFATAGYNIGDSVTITVYRGKTAKGTVTVTADQEVDLRSFGRVTKLVLDDSSTGYGYAYGLFQFRRVSTAAPAESADAKPAKARHQKVRRHKR